MSVYITDEKGNKYFVDATFEQVGAMSKAKLAASVEPVADYIARKEVEQVNDDIKYLQDKLAQMTQQIAETPVESLADHGEVIRMLRQELETLTGDST